MSLKDELAKIIAKKRVYASSRQGGTKGQIELGTVNDLLESMKRSGEAIYFDPVEAAQGSPQIASPAASEASASPSLADRPK